MIDKKLYLDCEFNGHLGQLISIALVPGTYAEKVTPKNYQPPFYFELHHPAIWNEWVEEHVKPELKCQKADSGFYGAVETASTFRVRSRLKDYLSKYKHPTIIADFPTDFYHLMWLMMGDQYENSFVYPCSMILIDNSECKSKNPHNALSDAVALRDWHESLQKEDSE